MEFKVTKNADGSAFVVLGGAINEDAEIPLKSILGELTGSGSVKFNFAHTTTINSLGVRAWVQFLRQAEVGRLVVFEQCTPDVIAQVNMIPSFASKADISSFYTNYVCESCNKNEKILIDKKNLKPKQMPEKAKCAHCSEEMETEELEDEYFAFLLR